VSAVSFELADEALSLASPRWLALGLAAGSLTYYSLDRAIQSRAGAAGSALALGAFLDGIPEQQVLGIGLAAGAGVSVSLLVAIFVSNLPEAIGSASEMREAGTSRRQVMRLWVAVAIVCTAASVIGYAIADSVGGNFKAAVNGFAAGALLVMMFDSMIPDAWQKGGKGAGLVGTLGFAVATGLSNSG
jgi:ZIP family zinc transporter